MSIKQYMTKIKSTQAHPVDTQAPTKNSDIFLILLIIFIAFASFGLGRLSVIEQKQDMTPILIEQRTQKSAVYTSVGKPEINQATMNESGSIVASKSGTKYHFPWCSGALRIKEENKIWFNTIEEARAAGYTPAANCKGLN